MKRKLLQIFSVLMMIVFCNLITKADNGDTIVISDDYGIRKVKVEVLNNVLPYTVLIRDKKGDVMYSEFINSGNKLEKFYDFSKFVFGKYTVEVYAKGLKNRQAFYVDGKFVMVQKSQSNNNPAFFSFDNNKLTVSYINDQQNEAVFQLLNYKGTVVFSDSLSRTMLIQKKYNLSKSRSGDYTAIITSGSSTYTKTISVGK